MSGRVTLKGVNHGRRMCLSWRWCGVLVAGGRVTALVARPDSTPAGLLAPLDVGPRRSHLAMADFSGIAKVNVPIPLSKSSESNTLRQQRG